MGEANHETHLSLYARDPDGLEFELTSFVPADKLPAGADRTASHPLDLEVEVARLRAGPSYCERDPSPAYGSSELSQP